MNEPADEPEDGVTPEELPPGAQRVTVRRAPRYGAFILTGVAIGVVIAAVLTVVFPDNGQFSSRALFGYVAVFCALILGLAGALLAVYVERPRKR